MGLNIKKLILLFVLCSGCLKKPPELSIDDGEPANIAAVEDALANGFGNVNPLQIKLNEFVSLAQTQQIYDLPERIGFQSGTSVQKREVFPDRVDYTFIQQLVEYDSGQNQKSSTSQRKISISTGAVQPMDVSQHPTIQFCRSIFNSSQNTASNSMSALEQKRMVAEKIKANLVRPLNERNSPISLESFCSVALACEMVGQCFNFETYTSFETPPSAVANSANCQNIPDCKLRVVTTKFAFVFMDVDSQGNELRNKILYEIKLSPETPYLSRLLSQCRQGIVPIDKTTKVYAKICDKVTDFLPGIN